MPGSQRWIRDEANTSHGALHVRPPSAETTSYSWKLPVVLPALEAAR